MLGGWTKLPKRIRFFMPAKRSPLCTGKKLCVTCCKISLLVIEGLPYKVRVKPGPEIKMEEEASQYQSQELHVALMTMLAGLPSKTVDASPLGETYPILSKGRTGVRHAAVREGTTRLPPPHASVCEGRERRLRPVPPLC